MRKDLEIEKVELDLLDICLTAKLIKMPYLYRQIATLENKDEHGDLDIMVSIHEGFQCLYVRINQKDIYELYSISMTELINGIVEKLMNAREDGKQSRS